ncbi:MAG: GNAT family N-acetyltransferase [Nocardioides sp.]|nr:GNAT family N-acetyltransferase [Nocardioides sp.]
MHGSGLWDLTVDDATVETLADRIPGLLAQSDHATELPEGRVHSDYWWMVDGDEFVGYLAIRHDLTEFLLNEGGHIGYGVRPSRRREGHATRALELALVRAREIGLDRVLLTCDDNTPSLRTIERNGGVLEDIRNGKRRYWISLA